MFEKRAEKLFGDYLQALRHTVHLSVEEAAKKIGLDSPLEIRAWETGKSIPSTLLIEKIAMVYHVPLVELKEILELEIKLRLLNPSP